MSKPAEFQIDDDKSADANIADFVTILKQQDEDLASVLGPVLLDMSYEKPVDQTDILDALYAATAPKENQP